MKVFNIVFVFYVWPGATCSHRKNSACVLNRSHMQVNPRPPKVLFVTRPQKGGMLQPLPGFSIRNT